ncbi:hypothetical protein FJZ26_04190 [Candidatus Parvarchaeota archaeon]|nr:hypothetical protein [Candidatus Parvarchaeota archaeon]
MVVLIEIMRSGNPYVVAWFASLTATAVDCFIYAILKDTLEKNAKKLTRYIHKKFSRFADAFPIAGFLVFGLPVPDEIGLALMEMTEIKLYKLAIVIFLSKFLTLLLFWKALAGQ